jgi:hypothetical protein
MNSNMIWSKVSKFCISLLIDKRYFLIFKIFSDIVLDLINEKINQVNSYVFIIWEREKLYIIWIYWN